MSKSITREQGPLRITTNPDGSQSVEARLDLLPPATDSYLADWFQSSRDERTCIFTFGKRSVRPEHLVTVLSLHLPLSQMKPLAETFVGKNREVTFLDQLERFVAERKLRQGGHLGAEKCVDPTTKEHSLAANFAVVGYNDADASLSFYRMPPVVDMRKIADTLSHVQILPVVRVDTTVGILLEFVRSVRQFAEDSAAEP